MWHFKVDCSSILKVFYTIQKNMLLLFFLLMPLSSNAQSIQEKLLQGELVLDTNPVDVDKIAYSTYGQADNPWIVLIHGLHSNQGTWKSVVEELSKNFQVLTYDQRGHGDTLINSENFSSSTMARDLLVLMDKLQINKAHIVGHSMGGRTAIRFGSQYPERTLTVTIEDMHVLGRSKLLPDATELLKQIKPLYKPVFNSAQEFFDLYQPYLNFKNIEETGHFGEVDKKTGLFSLHLNPYDEVKYSLYQNQALQENLTDALVNIKAPITFFAAGNLEQAVLFGKGLEHVKQQKQNANIILFQEAGHSIHKEAQVLFVDQLIKSTKLAGRTCRSYFN